MSLIIKAEYMKITLKYFLILLLLTGINSTAFSDEKNKDAIEFSFYSPWEDVPHSFNESSFSVPQPIVVLDELVMGDVDKHPGKTVIQQTGPEQLKIRISGRVYDSIADIVAGGKADIHKVKLVSSTGGTIATLPVTASIDKEETLSISPTKEEQDGFFMLESMRPYPYVGRFESKVITMPISSIFNDIHVEAKNISGKQGISTIAIKSKVNREMKRYDITAELRQSDDEGLVLPIMVHINDPSVNQSNVDKVHATLNGSKVGLRIIGGKLQLDRPIMGVNFTPPKSIPNIVNVAGNPNKFVIHYKDVKTEFNWSFTAN